MGKVRVLLIGIGGYGQGYLRELLSGNDPSVELAGVADPYASSSLRLDELKARNISVYKNPLDFYVENRTGSRAADLAIISSPIHTHYAYAISCMLYGSHVLCEKPVSGSLAELDALMAAEKKLGLFAAVGFQLCFSRDVLALKQDILDGLFGKPLEFKALFLPRRGTIYYNRNNWAGKLHYEGSTILDSPLQNACAHELLNMLFLLGNEMNRSAAMESLEAELWQGRPDIQNYDAAALRIKTETGVRVLFYTAHCVKQLFTGPMWELRFENAVIKRGPPPDMNYTACFNDGRIKTYSGIDKGSPLQKLYDCADAVHTGIPPVCTMETARSHLHCVISAQQYPVQKVPPEILAMGTDDDGDVFYYIPGLKDAFLSAYEKNALPRENGFNIPGARLFPG